LPLDRSPTLHQFRRKRLDYDERTNSGASLDYDDNISCINSGASA
jgi:hypothetical protein